MIFFNFGVIWSISIHNRYRIISGRFKDYISSSKTNGYQGIHTTVDDQDWDMIEFQIQTFEMEQLNKFWLAAHFTYKNHDSNFSKTPEWAQGLFSKKNEGTDPNEFFKKLKAEILNSDINCISTKREKNRLPINSTLLDFAYSINTDTWNKFKFAYINWEQVNNPVHILKNWNVIDIITCEHWDNMNFKIEYLSMVKTDLAKLNLLKLLKFQSKEKKIELWEYLLNKSLSNYWLNHFEDLSFIFQNSILHKYWKSDNRSLYKSVWNWDINTDDVIANLAKLYEFEISPKEVALKLFVKVIDYKTRLNAVRVFQILNIKIENLIDKKEYYLVNCFIENIDHLNKLILELKRLPNIRDLKRIIPNKLKIFYLAIFPALFLLIISFLFLSTFNQLQTGHSGQNWNNYSTLPIVILNFIAQCLLSLIFINISKTVLGGIFNYTKIWASLILLNTFVIWLLFYEIFYIEGNYIWSFSISIFFIIYWLLINNYYSYNNKKLKFIYQ